MESPRPPLYAYSPGVGLALFPFKLGSALYAYSPWPGQAPSQGLCLDPLSAPIWAGARLFGSLSGPIWAGPVCLGPLSIPIWAGPVCLGPLSGPVLAGLACLGPLSGPTGPARPGPGVSTDPKSLKIRLFHTLCDETGLSRRFTGLDFRHPH